MFGLCHLLALRFAPRLRDPSERRLYIVDRRADYGALDCLIGGAINLRKIEENWDEILRMTASIRAGTAAPSVLLWRLAAYPRQNALARALREIGCLERTLFISTGSQILRSAPIIARLLGFRPLHGFRLCRAVFAQSSFCSAERLARRRSGYG